MAIGELITINSTKPAKLSGYTVSREKLFSEADRNLAGELKATFIGVFPVLKLQFATTTQSEMNTIIGLLEPVVLNVSWWDEDTQTILSGEFYAGRYDVPLYSKNLELYGEFSVNLISYKKL